MSSTQWIVSLTAAKQKAVLPRPPPQLPSCNRHAATIRHADIAITSQTRLREELPAMSMLSH
eukprot:903681-Pleurochrysis_carterae.AAC.1